MSNMPLQCGVSGRVHTKRFTCILSSKNWLQHLIWTSTRHTSGWHGLFQLPEPWEQSCPSPTRPRQRPCGFCCRWHPRSLIATAPADCACPAKSNGRETRKCSRRNWGVCGWPSACSCKTFRDLETWLSNNFWLACATLGWVWFQSERVNQHLWQA